MTNILGISLGHDTNFAHVSDGEIVSMVEAERYFRQKRYKLDCSDLSEGKRASTYQYVDIKDLEIFLEMIGKDWGYTFDAIAVQNQGRLDEFENLKTLLTTRGFKFGESYNVNHHLSHAALAFYTSPYEESLILSYDGAGNDGTTVLFNGDINDGVEYIERDDHRFGQSYNNLGFIVGVSPDVSGTGAGKTMGLAAYGEVRDEWLPYCRQYVREYRKAPEMPVEGLRNYGKSHRINSVGLNEIPELKEFVNPASGDRSSLFSRSTLRSIVSGGRSNNVELRLPGPEDKLSQDLAATVQAAWTQEVLDILSSFKDVSRTLCVTGGCALNGVTNYAIQETGWFDAAHFIPNPTDCGLSAGAALYINHRNFKSEQNRTDANGSPYLGVEPFDADQLPSLRRQYPNRELPADTVTDTIAKLIHNDLIVGVIRGRYEVGPRALGNRSILCNPLNKDMKEILNDKVKHREWYRPFAPVVTVEDSRKYFDNLSDIPYMSIICHTRPEYADILPSITHVDGSARLQTVSRSEHPFLHELLKKFEMLSGVPILLNTSFNPGGEPIINYNSVGLQMLDETELDLVLIDNLLFCRKGREDLLSF